MNSSVSNPLALGETVITVRARESVHPYEVLSALWRHANEPWGKCFDPENEKNAISMDEDRRLVSNHVSSRGERFKIATEPERGVTTVFLAYETDLSHALGVQASALNICEGCGG